MKERIEKYFIEEKKVTGAVAKVLSALLLKYVDIAEEFCYWLEKREYKKDGQIRISGYSAKDISLLAPHFDAAGVYNFMVTLRDNPKKAAETIENKFPSK